MVRPRDDESLGSSMGGDVPTRAITRDADDMAAVGAAPDDSRAAGNDGRGRTV